MALLQLRTTAYAAWRRFTKIGYRNVGVGTIHRSDAQVCANVVSAMIYWGKDRQHMRLKPIRMRTFGMGQLRG
jgi:hypothetical protein